MGTKILLSFVVLILMFSCDRENEELECNSYFLEEESNAGDYMTKIYYNPDGQISALVSQAGSVNNRLDVYYDQNKRIKEVKNIAHSQVTEFFHDGSGRLVSTIRYHDGSRLDSFAIEYDDSGRIAKRSIFKGLPSSTHLDSYYTIEYPAIESLKVNFYSRVPFTADTFEYTGTFSYTLDSKNRPYPNEYYSIYLSWTNVVLANNITSLEISDKNGTVTSMQTYNYSYNPRGYPLEEKTLGSAKKYRYACEPPLE